MQRILLVDDDDGNRLTLSILLEDEGFTVDVAASFAAAAALLGSAAQAYDAVLLDQHLPDGLGTGLLPLVRARMPGAKAILVSGSAELRDDMGADAVLAKGSAFPDLLALLRRACGGP